MEKPAVASWDLAPREIRAMAARRRPDGRSTLVGITGPVGAGKSLLASRVAEQADLVVSTDHYLPDYEQVPYAERDDPRHADLELLATHLLALQSGLSVPVPVWSFQSHRREGFREVTPPAAGAGLVICEGIHALHGSLAALLDVAVFVEAPSQVRWARWERLEVTGARGWGVPTARRFFDQVAEPTFAGSAAAYRGRADLVVVNG